MRKMIMTASVMILLHSVECSAEIYDRDGKSFIFLPMAGQVRNKITYHIPGNAAAQSLKDKGNLYGVYLMAVQPQFVIGGLSHYSTLKNSDEDGCLLFTYYYFRNTKKLQPMIGCSVESIYFLTELSYQDVIPLNSLDIHGKIWGFNPVIGLSFKSRNANRFVYYRITPFIGYFNEQVRISVSSPGMTIAGRNQTGFKTISSNNFDYTAAGVTCSIRLYHAINVSSKLYFRLKKDEKTLYTMRNQINFFVTKKNGISCKYDYFKDEFETNTFLFFGPSIIF